MNLRLGPKRAVLVACLIACSKNENRPDLSLEVAPSAHPVDHLAKGELIAGADKALTLTLPKGMRIDHAFVKVVYASGPFSPEDVANFIRGQVRDGSVSPGASATVFEAVRVPTAPQVLLNIRVQPGESGLGTSLEVRDETPPPAMDLPDEAARWKAAGLKPNGQPLDPKHMQ